VAGSALLLAGCAQFDDATQGQQWKPAPQLTAEAGPQPQLPEGRERTVPSKPPTSPTPVPPPDGCKDFDQAVIATCLDTVTAIAALPSDGSSVGALAGERRSGTVFLVSSEQEKSVFAELDVAATGDGGLTGLALSPSYAEDGLAFAYITTATDNRVVRFAQGQPAKPVLTGIPKGNSGNRGALFADGHGSLLVATGNAGDPNAAADPASLAGKVLRITPQGEPAPGNPDTASPVIATGLHAPGGMCGTPDGSRVWVTDQGPKRDALYRLREGDGLAAPAWTWPDRPGVAGCADWSDVIAIATEGGEGVQNLPLTRDGAVGGKPQVTMDGTNGPSYGRLGGLARVTPDVAVAGTVNKAGGKPVSSDDRVVLIVRQPAAGAGRE
jgi:glucose/arabinose dehydrogenase